MKPSISLQILTRLLSGELIEDRDLRLLACLPAEDQHLDFKDGTLLSDKKQAARVVRQYVCAFANSDGGILVIGIGDKKCGDSRPFTATVLPGGKRLDEWASNVLQVLAGQLIPPPRIQVVSVEGNDVLVIGTARAPALVSYAEDGETRYYLRLGDSTCAAPAYLISDLLLGRRSHPSLEIRPLSDAKPGVNNSGSGSCSIVFGFELENCGMLPANDIVVGVIAWARSLPNSASHGRPASDYLKTFVEHRANAPTDFEGHGLSLVHVSSRRSSAPPLGLGAFEVGRAMGIGELLVPQAEWPTSAESALYVCANGHHADWWQLSWSVPSPRGDGTGTVKLTRCPYQRPLVTWGQ